MTKLTKEAVREFVERRYSDNIADICIFDDEQMAMVLMYANTSIVNRVTVDINSDGDIEVWTLERAHFDEFYHRSPDEDVYYEER